MSNDESLPEDTAAVSEFTGVLILVMLTIIITASIGVQVLVDTEEEQTVRNANFTCQYFGDSSRMIVTHSRGDEFNASNLQFSGPRDANATWAETAGFEPNRTIGPGAIVQLSEDNAYGEQIRDGDTIRVRYVNETGFERQLDKLSTDDCS